MLERIKFLSLNINGLRDPLKRSKIFKWLKSLKIQLIILQDIHFLPGDTTLWSQQWGLPVLWSSHNAILSTDQSFTLSHYIIPNIPPRMLLATISIPSISHPLGVCSIYIPADRLAQAKFLSIIPVNLGIELSILAGDCNIIANYTLDHVPSLERSPSAHWSQFSGIVQGWGLVDLFHSLSPNESQISHWQQTVVGRVGT